VSAFYTKPVRPWHYWELARTLCAIAALVIQTCILLRVFGVL
jgi:hypothetical protein